MPYPFLEANENLKLAVWRKGTIIPPSNGNTWDGNAWRFDSYGSVMKYSEHGNRDSVYGWEIDHIKPVAKGGSDELSNLQPLNWKSNAAKGDK